MTVFKSFLIISLALSCENGGNLEVEVQFLKGSKGDRLSPGLERQNPLFKVDVLKLKLLISYSSFTKLLRSFGHPYNLGVNIFTVLSFTTMFKL